MEEARKDGEKISWKVWTFSHAVDNKNDYEFRIHRVNFHASPFYKWVLFLITIFIIGSYWASILSQESVLITNFLCVTSSVFFMGTNLAVLLWSAICSPEKLIKSGYSYVINGCMLLSIIYSFLGILYSQFWFKTCLPLVKLEKGACDDSYFPEGIILYMLFYPVLCILAHPNLSWRLIICFYVCCATISIVSLVFAPLHNVPNVVLSTLFSCLAILMVRLDSIKSFLLYRDIGEQGRLRTEAEIGLRLRRMIGGVSHDLKSPLSALALGLETWKSLLSDNSRLLNSFSTDEKMRQSLLTQLNSELDMLGLLQQAEKSMESTIGRCVDANRAIAGLPICPVLSSMDVGLVVKDVVHTFQREHSHLKMNLQMLINDNHCDYQQGILLQCDEMWLRESLSCLLANAVKFSDYSFSADKSIVIQVHLMRNQSEKLIRPNSWRNHVSFESSSTAIDSLKESLNPFHRIRISVLDEGVGVKAETATTLFTFLGHEDQDSVGGTGLGLFILACRIKALKGTFGYLPRLTNHQRASGSEFWFELPFSEEMEQFLQSVDSNTQMLDTITDINNDTIECHDDFGSDMKMDSKISCVASNEEDIVVMLQETPPFSDFTIRNDLVVTCPYVREKQEPRVLRVLVVDDSLPIRKMCTAILRKWNFTVSTAVNGRESVQFVTLAASETLSNLGNEGLGLDLILMDIQMPVMDGIQATREIRAFEAQQNNESNNRPVPIIGMSACSDIAIIESALEAGMNYFLPKPFPMDKFNEILKALNLLCPSTTTGEFE